MSQKVTPQQEGLERAYAFQLICAHVRYHLKEAINFVRKPPYDSHLLGDLQDFADGVIVTLEHILHEYRRQGGEKK